MLMRRIVLPLLFIFCSAAPTLAQKSNPDDYPKTEFFIGLSALGEVNSNSGAVDVGLSSDKGFEVSVIRNVNKYLGFKGDFSAHFDTKHAHAVFNLGCTTPPCPTSTQDFTIDTRLYNFLVGPEIKGRNHTRLTPFAHALFGVARGSTDFRTSGPILNLTDKGSDTGFAMAFGGGLDIRATERVGFRASMDYNPAFLGNSEFGRSGRRDHVRLSLGIVFH
jgi:opacity protein-like surface antigen